MQHTAANNSSFPTSPQRVPWLLLRAAVPNRGGSRGSRDTPRLSLQPREPDSMTARAVIPREPPTTTAGGPWPDRGFSSVSCLSLSATERGRRGRQGRQASGGRAGSRRVCPPTIWLEHFQPALPTPPKASPFLPVSLQQVPTPLWMRPIRGELLRTTAFRGC